MQPVNLHEFEAIAREILPQPAYDYYAGGADDEVTLAENREAFRRRFIRYRTLVDVSQRDLSTRLLDLDLEHPIVLAPTAMQRLAHPDGEAATARGAQASGALHTVSTVATTSLEDVMAASAGPKWFQLYCYGDRAISESLLKRAVAAGYRAIVLTVDLPALGRRERDLRNSFVMPPGMSLANFEGPTSRPEGTNALVSWASGLQTDTLSWDDIGWIREAAPLPLILKGVVRADDAERAVREGIDAIWVSNHGGRQLDGAIPTLDALTDIVPAVGGAVPLIVDGGVRRGTDILKGLALGATAVAIGRPQLWGLAAGGAEGVARVVEMLREEFSLAMALTGCRSISEITSDLIA